MKKNKGFTLVELLSVIVLLGIIAIIIVPNFESLLSDSKLDLYNKQIEMIKASANLWSLDKNNKIFLSENKEWPYIITLGDLQVSGFIDDEINNPKTNEFFSSNLIIEINKENNNYTYKVNDGSIDELAPTLILKGDLNYEIEVKGEFNDPGIEATDISGEDISENIVSEVYKNGILIESIDTQTLGNYTIRYTIEFRGTDQRKHTAIAVRRVKVVDTTAPVIICSECTTSEIVLESTNNYTLPEATAKDNYDDFVLISKIGSFSTNIPGKKKVTYIATDSSGNSSSIEINLIVKDTISPVITSIDKTNNENGTYTYIINAIDNGSGIKEYSYDGGKTWQKSNKFVITLNADFSKFVVKDNAGNISTNQQKQEYVKEYIYTGDVQEFSAPKDGYYKIETWGAQGGSETSTVGGKGAYTSGIVNLSAKEQLYIYVGGMGNFDSTNTKLDEVSGYNGGGGGRNGGGGATDVRLASGTWNNAEGLKSRIMVASGGGGVLDNTSGALAGIGGDLVGNDGIAHSDVAHSGDYIGYGATQITGGKIGSTATTGTSGVFGIGGNGGVGPGDTSHIGSGGGGGYYGGGGSAWHSGAGGGSSFISGYAGVNAITSSTSLTPTNNTIHYSNKYFINGKMEAGVNSGNGKAKITYIGESKPERKNTKLNNVRYIKDCATGNSLDGFVTWMELQAIKDGINVALNKNIKTTGTPRSEHPLEIIIDGDITSSNYGEVSEAGSQCITVDLGSTYNLDEIAVWHYWLDNRTYYDNITYVSSDNSNWTEVIHNNEAETSNGKRVSAYEN